MLFKIVTLLLLASMLAANPAPVDPDEKLDLAQMVASRGFTLQVHEVTTEDGYILTVHRVVTKNYTNDAEYCKNRKPVIVNHGLASNSANFLMTSHEVHPFNSTKCGDNFGLCLADTGKYDVWLNNDRGNGYSIKHKNMTKDSPGFYHFAMDQMAKYDLPAVIDMVRNKTGHKTVGYVGHSQGCAIMFALLSTRPEYAEIVRPFVAWAPAVFVTHMKSWIKVGIPFIDDYLKMGAGLNVADLFFMFTGKKLDQCRVGDSEPACYKFLEDLAGPTNHMYHERMIVYVKYFPAPVSMWQLVHFGQNHLSGKFSYLDFKDPKKNLAAYGSEHAPEYPLSKISPKAKIAIAWGSTDYLVMPEDVQHLISIVKPVLKDNLIEYKVPSEKFNHVDFLIGKGAGKLLFDQTISWLDQYA